LAFLGRKKRGDFFGLEAKKVGREEGRRETAWKNALRPALLSASPLAACGAGPSSAGPNGREPGGGSEQNEEDFFGLHPKKRHFGSRHGQG